MYILFETTNNDQTPVHTFTLSKLCQ